MEWNDPGTPTADDVFLVRRGLELSIVVLLDLFFFCLFFFVCFFFFFSLFSLFTTTVSTIDAREGWSKKLGSRNGRPCQNQIESNRKLHPIVFVTATKLLPPKRYFPPVVCLFTQFPIPSNLENRCSVKDERTGPCLTRLGSDRSHTQEIGNLPRIQQFPQERHPLRESLPVERLALDPLPDAFHLTPEPIRRRPHHVRRRQARAVTENPSRREHVHELAVLGRQLRPLEPQLQRHLFHGVVEIGQVGRHVRHAFAGGERFEKGGRVEGEQAGDVAGRVAVEEMVVHAGEVGHLGEDVDEGLAICQRCGREVEDVGFRVGFRDPGLDLSVIVEVGWVGVVCSHEGRDEATEGSDDGVGVLEEREVVQLGPVRAVQ